VDWIWAVIGLAFVVWLVLVTLFTPRIDYHVTTPLRPDSPDFLHVIQATCEAAFHYDNAVHIFANGAQFYPAMREAIMQARLSVNLEAYIFKPGQGGRPAHRRDGGRARAGVEVRLVLDAIGSARMRGEPCGGCRRPAAGCTSISQITWYRLHRINNRTHRELLIVDGRVAFTGGAGVADWWLTAVSLLSRLTGTLVGGHPNESGRHGVTRWHASRGRSWRRCRACSPRTGWSAAARS
jgi:cardiolipin synthase A/B